jgi:HSP90 family molecular chaperone
MKNSPKRRLSQGQRQVRLKKRMKTYQSVLTKKQIAWNRQIDKAFAAQQEPDQQARHVGH